MSEFSDGLRAMADWFDRHPDLPGSVHGAVMIFADADELPVVARALGTAEKDADEYGFRLRRRFGPVPLSTYTARDAVCERVKVGERTVTRHVPPEGVELVEVAEVEDVYEWRCPESILRPADKPVPVAS